MIIYALVSPLHYYKVILISRAQLSCLEKSEDKIKNSIASNLLSAKTGRDSAIKKNGSYINEKDLRHVRVPYSERYTYFTDF